MSSSFETTKAYWVLNQNNNNLNTNKDCSNILNFQVCHMLYSWLHFRNEIQINYLFRERERERDLWHLPWDRLYQNMAISSLLLDYLIRVESQIIIVCWS